MPNVNGLQLLAEVKKDHTLKHIPVLMLTAKGDPMDRIIGLEIGADDYLPKPFDLDELEARVRALHRRQHENNAELASSPSRASAISFDKDSGAVYHGKQLLDLTPRESALLKALLTRPGHAISKERLFELVFPGASEVQYEAVEVVVYRLRKKLQSTGAQLMTLRGLGYLLKMPA